ncbi:MAG: replication initiator protein A [Bacteroidota bacterium]
MTQAQQNLLPERHPTKDFFIADIFDSTAFKDDMASMEHPVFSLSKKRDMRNLEYKSGDLTVIIKPTTDGLPTIFDKDVLLYCGSLLMEEVNKGKVPPKTLRISSHDLLVATNRNTNGDGYKRLKQALDRLKGVSVKTNIKTNKREITSAFGLIESYNIVESSRVKKRMVKLEITLSDWFYNSILGKEVLTINRDYFRLGKALERRLYEIARKYCGKQDSWQISLTKLKEKTGSTSHVDKFRYFIREIAKSNHLPDYFIRLLTDDMVHFHKTQSNISLDDLPSINQETLEKGRKMTKNSNWNFEDIHQQFSLQLLNGFKPENVNGAFIGFVKKKLAQKA